MSEELKIIIKAVTDEAKKELQEVTKELEKTKKTSKDAGKDVDSSMKKIAKGAAVAVAGIAALTTAMVGLGKSAVENQKNFAKLNTAFQAVGSTASQAAKTYDDLYRFLGDGGKATEAAGHLAQITTNQKDLAQWTKITQGIYATFGDSLPIESLTEAANETIKVGTVTGAMADALNWAGVSEDAFNSALANTNSYSEREALVRQTLNGLYENAANIYERNNQALLNYNQSQANLDRTIANTAQYTVPLMTALNNLASTLLTVLKPALETVAAVLIVFVQWISAAAQFVGSFFGMFGDEGKKSTESVAKGVEQIKAGTSGVSDGFNKATKAAEKLKKTTMGFDELNIVSSGSTSAASDGATGGGGSGAGAISIPTLDSNFEMPDMGDFQKTVDKVRKKMEGILVLAGLTAAAILGWKIGNFINDLKTVEGAMDAFVSKIKTAGGALMIAAGAILLIQGYSDAWANGIDWENFALMLSGIALIVGGLALAFGPVAAGIGAIAGGIALVVVGIKDWAENGYSLEAVLTILAGVIAVVVGVCLAFNAALLANPITWIIIAIAALVAAFVVLWNECEGFRNFWIAVWEKAKELFASFVRSIQPLIDAIVGAFKEAWELIKVIWNNYLVPLFEAAWKAIKAVWDAVKPYFAAIWEGIKKVFSVVVDVLGSYFKAAWEVIKAVWDVVVSYFTMIWENIKLVFKVVKDVLSGNFKDAWEGIKQIFSNFVGFFKDAWDGVKRVFAAVGTFFSDIFTDAWNGIKKIFARVGTFFQGVWDTIKGIFAKVGSTIGNAISDAVKGAINWVLEKAVGLINGFIDGINWCIKVINKIPGVEISKIKRLDVPQFAEGGVVDRATLGVFGEAGKEAVIPLENNTEWMDILAERINGKNPQKIVLMIDGKELGYATIGSINNITRQTGSLPLVLA
jgi:phage-related protein